MNEHLNEQLSALVDGELTGDALVAAESHVLECDACRAALDDLRALKRRAAALDDRAPARDLWTGIAQRIADAPRGDVVAIEAAPSRRRQRTRFAFSLPQLAAAAVLVMALSGGAVALMMKDTPPAQTADPRVFDPGSDVTLVSGRLEKTPAGSALQSYDVAIRDLERTLATRRAVLDTATVRVLEQSMRLIDTAITQARDAVARDPNNLYLNSHLQNALGRKLELLRHVATLPTVS